MKILILFMLTLAGCQSVNAQLCPGGGSNLLTAVPFDPAWIYGCNTGTSCNGGVALDNRSACIPVPALDVCAPTPSCTTPSNNGSNVWFTFYASSPNAVISCFQNTSLVLGIQAFSGSMVCGGLTELGCAVSGGPSSGVKLTLTGLLPGTMYYFRIYGSSNPVSQRTGLYCFCGSSGLSTFNILSASAIDLSAVAGNNGILLTWQLSAVNAIQSMELERSTDGTDFDRVAGIRRTGEITYSYTDEFPEQGNNYYRLKLLHSDGHFSYTSAVRVIPKQMNSFRIMGNLVKSSLQVKVSGSSVYRLVDIAGHVLKNIRLSSGLQSIGVEEYGNGLYCIQSASGGPSQKFYIAR